MHTDRELLIETYANFNARAIASRIVLLKAWKFRQRANEVS